jgi:Holliday junction resolvase RusA-like endonuclease
MLQILLDGVHCISKQRPRSYVRNGKIAHYMNNQYTAWKNDIATRLRAAYSGPPLEQMLSLNIVVGYQKAPKGDVDNLAGALMDAANGVLWHDDGQVKRLCIERLDKSGTDSILIEVGAYQYGG